MPATGVRPLTQAAETAVTATVATRPLSRSGSTSAAMLTAGNTPRKAAPLAWMASSAAVLTTATTNKAVSSGGLAGASHIAASVAPQNATSAIVTASAGPLPPGAGCAWNDVVTTNAIAATASARIARKGARHRSWDRSRTDGGAGLAAAELTTKRYGGTQPPSALCGRSLASRSPPGAGRARPPPVRVTRPGIFHLRSDDGEQAWCHADVKASESAGAT